MKLYQVGGSVRDRFIGLKPIFDDIDYAVEAKNFEEMKNYISNNPHYKIFLETKKYGTIRAKNTQTHEVIDFTLCRSDGIYSDNRRPDTIITADIYTDLSRRDFTMNAIAIDIETKEIIDPHNGIKDINNKIIRCVGNAFDRMKKDPLRLLRALRFSITKNMILDEDIQQCFTNNKIINLFKKISIDRKKEELHKMFKYDTKMTIKVLNILSEDFLNAIFEDAIWLMPTNKKRSCKKIDNKII